jgi:hypothetical protein
MTLWPALVLGARASSPLSLLPIPAPPEEQPPMLIFIMAGCSGSSATGHMLRMLVNCTKGWKDYDNSSGARQLGEEWQGFHGEAFKEKKNPWFQKLKEKHPDWNTTQLWKQTLEEWLGDVRSENQTYFVDATRIAAVLNDPELADLLRDIPIVPARRTNLIDRAICSVKDCMDHDELGYPVYKGKRSDLCLARRRELKGADDELDYKAWLDVNVLQDHLEGMMGRDEEPNAIFGRELPQEVTYDKLMQVEYPDSDATGEFDDGVREWMTLLDGLQVRDVSSESVATCLRPSIGNWHRPFSHKDEVVNFEEVKELLCKGGKEELCAMLREAPEEAPHPRG